MQALWFNNIKAVRKMFAAHPHYFDSIDGGERTAMHFAVFTDNPEVIQTVYALAPTLLDKRDGNGETPMHHAARGGSLHIVDELHKLNSRAYTIKNVNRQTPADLAEGVTLKCHIDNLKIERSLDVVFLLEEEL
jgi:ankyrin repeat protein